MALIGPMQHRASLLATLTALARLALVVPFLALALIPQSYMPDRAAAGGMVLILCTDEGAVEIAIDPATGAPVQKQKAGDPCIWSLAGAAGLLPQAVALPLPQPGVLRDLAATETDLWRPAHDPLGVLARGPPALI
jgi:hypothetical protein